MSGAGASSGERLELHLGRRGDRFEVMTLKLQRLAGISRLLEGRPAAEGLALLPRLYALCGMAQREAGLRALEAAAGQPPTPEAAAVRAALVDLEAVSEHASRCLLDWPALIGAAPDLSGARAIRSAAAALVQALSLGTPSAPAADALNQAVARHIGAAVDTFASWNRWLERGETLPARLLSAARTAEQPWPIPTPALAVESLDPAAIAARLDQEPSFPRHAHWLQDGTAVPCETSPFTRHAHQPPLAEAVAHWGPGLASRLLARLIDLHQRLERLTTLPALPAPTAPTVTGSGQGTGVVDTARGRLVHRVHLADGRVSAWRILAPTDWTCHPQGILWRALNHAPAAEPLPHWWLAALDPCLPVEQPRHG